MAKYARNRKRLSKAPVNQTKEQRILARPKVAIGTFPGANRSRKFTDRRRAANKNACRGKSW